MIVNGYFVFPPPRLFRTLTERVADRIADQIWLDTVLYGPPPTFERRDPNVGRDPKTGMTWTLERVPIVIPFEDAKG